jgi:tRNA dimethylallyltransferase
VAALSHVPAICLMGPTASGKTELAVRLVEALPLAIVSVDSAMVYRGMDIGTAKPAAETLKRAPHRLIDIRDPEQPYSAGHFVRDAGREMAEIRAAGRIPLLVGGTMMYFRALTRGIAVLPAADRTLRSAIDAEAGEAGWPALHAKLAAVDPAAAARIEPNDSQRIQRALEVYRASGRPLSEWQKREGPPRMPPYLRFGLVPEPRAELHRRIELRFKAMLAAGFVDEVARLRRRPLLTERSPSMRAVGYRQIWQHLDGRATQDGAAEKAVAATRQLAKRQLTWLRSEDGFIRYNPLEVDTFGSISAQIAGRIEQL